MSKTSEEKYAEFLATPEAEALREVQSLLQGVGEVALFGGAARDILLNGTSAKPRDYDLVVDVPRRKQLRNALGTLGPTINGFSGFSFKMKDRAFDVWCLRDTWGFTVTRPENPTFRDLLDTTFFNVEGIVLTSTEALDGGFTKAFETKVLEVNLPVHPFPELCLVRTSAFVKRFGFRLGPRLEDWILLHRKFFREEGLLRVQKRYFGYEVCTPKELLLPLYDACVAAEKRG